jgi:2,3-bisphosphoglycerate-independent phosphoglycerate mutase
MQDLIRPLVTKNDSKIILLVMDGLGGLPQPEGQFKGRTELEAAETPNLDALAQGAACGLHLPVKTAITPGSGPGHLALFGYDPLEHQIGRGILEALGLGIDVENTDIALRCNYATLKDGVVRNRRAGRIPTPESRKLTEILQKEITRIEDADITFGPGMEHRFAVRMRFPEPLEPGSAAINDTDPQKEGLEPFPMKAQTPQAERVVSVAEKLITQVSGLLEGQEMANHILLRGFSEKPRLTDFGEAFGLKAFAIAAYPMYRGVARLVGMEASELEGDLREEIDLLKANYEKYDFFFFHVKKVDSYGEDGNFEAKKDKIAEVDRFLPEIMALEPDVIIVTGDHSTPALYRSHSWHPVPFLLKSQYVLGGLTGSFSERECFRGELGVIPSTSLMPLALANAGRLKKFGA